MIHIGIDPGKSAGAIAGIDSVGEVIFKQEFPKIGKEVDLQALNSILQKYYDDYDGNMMVMIEDPGMIFGVSKSSQASLAKNQGHLEGLVVGNMFRYELVKPKVWQKVMWTGVTIQKKSNGKTNDTKKTSLLAVKRLFPRTDLTKAGRSVTPHDGIIDAILLAEYSRRTLDNK